MCGRYVLYGPKSRLSEAFALVDCPDFEARYNIAPQSDVLVIRHKPETGRVAQRVRWGLVPNWAKDAAIGARLNNARGETVAEKPAFRSSFARHRCLIPANGFYEWQRVERAGKPAKQPYYIHPAEADGFFAFAGLLARWKAADGSDLVTTCVITSEANALMEPIHERMPVILDPTHFDAWLAPDNRDLAGLRRLLRPAAVDGMRANRVGTAVNRAGVDDASLLAPIAD